MAKIYNHTGKQKRILTNKNWIDYYLEYTRTQESPTLFHLWTAISVIAASLRRNVYIDRGFKALRVFPNLYIVLVAPSGVCRKSIATNIGVGILRQIDDIRILHEKVTPEGLVAAMQHGVVQSIIQKEDKEKEREIKEREREIKEREREIKEREKNKNIRLVIKSTIDKNKEEIQEELNSGEVDAINVNGIKNKNSNRADGDEDEDVDDGDNESNKVIFKESSDIYIYAPELSVFIGSASYSTGLVEILTSLYEGKDVWDYTTRTKGQIVLKNVVVNLLGASNPIWLAKSLSEDAFGGGFIGRTIYVFQTEVRQRIPWPSMTARQYSLETALIHDLRIISKLEGTFSIDQKARDYYEKWYLENKSDFTGRLASYYTRKEALVHKVAMILSVARDNSLCLTEDDYAKSIKLLDNVEETMPQAFAYVGATNEARIAQRILEVIKQSDGVVLHKELIRKIRHLIRGKAEFYGIIETLEEAELLKRVIHGEWNVTLYMLDEYYNNVYLKKKAEAEAELEAAKAAEEALKKIQIGSNSEARSDARTEIKTENEN